jgi:hypothetical protein
MWVTTRIKETGPAGAGGLISRRVRTFSAVENARDYVYLPGRLGGLGAAAMCTRRHWG